MAGIKVFGNYFPILILFIVFCYVKGQSIKFENGKYNGLVFGIDGENVDETECASIRRNLEAILPEFSKSLLEATSGKAEFGQVNVLIPENWNINSCGLSNITSASTLYSYAKSHFQITTNHPLAETLPWTKQYKPCSQQGETIVIPLSFINNSPGFLDAIRGKLMLTEWVKYRYGVFDEIGFDSEDELFAACYTNANQAYLSTCTSVSLAAIAGNKSACSIDYLMKNKDKLNGQMNQGPTSILSAPYFDQTSHFCNSTTHNPWTDTKHNIFCGRRSVSEIIYEHTDFKNPIEQHLSGRIDIRFVQHESKWPPAYAFIIEDSIEMRDEFKLLHVKQGIAQFLEMLDENIWVQVTLFTGESGENDISTKPFMMRNDDEKRKLLEFIPDFHTIPGRSTWNGKLDPVIDYFVANIMGPTVHSWNVFLVVSSPFNISDMSHAINRFEQTKHTISVITFDSGLEESKGKQLLEWYKIMNTRSVIALPYCRNPRTQGLCTLRTSSLIVEYLASQMNNQQYEPRLIQKVNETELQNAAGQTADFNVNIDVDLTENFYILMSIPGSISNSEDLKSYVSLIPPNGNDSLCVPERLLSYEYVLKFSGSNCVQSGTWNVIMKKHISSQIAQINSLFISVFHEKRNAALINVIPSLGVRDMTEELQPNFNMTPVFISVTTKHGNPILNAKVIVQIYNPNLLATTDSPKPTAITLRDDGDSSNGADQTGNDGIYSAYLAGYSTESSSFHLCSVEVHTDENSMILTQIQSPKAAYLNEKLTNKCCGKIIQPSETNPLQAFTFRTLLHGFKIIEPWKSTRLQPGQIGSIGISSETDSSISVQFSSVAGDVNDPSVDVVSFQACCVAENATYLPTPPTEHDCKSNTAEITSSSNSQTVLSMDKNVLVNAFLPSEADRSGVQSLQCALRAVNSNSHFGALSWQVVVIDVGAIIRGGLGGNEEEKKCDSISDDCLPILIFWILIGCVALLVVLLILALIICYCCMSKNKKDTKKVDSRRDLPRRVENDDIGHKYNKSPDFNNARNSTNFPRETEEPKVVKELFINHAYIQDGEGEVKIIADSGEILRKPLNNSHPPNVNDSERRFTRNIPNTRPPPEVQTVTEMSPDNMQVFKPEPYPNPSKSIKQKHTPRQNHTRQLNQRPEIIHANPMLRTDSVQNIPQQHQPQVMPIPTGRQPPAQAPDPALVYATVSRVARPKPNYEDFPPTSPVKPTPHYMVPHNHNSLPRMVQVRSRDPLPNFSGPPPQVHPYPSTSDTDSEMQTPVQTSQRRPPRFTKPPPYPAGSQIVNRPQSSHSTFSPAQEAPPLPRTNVSPGLPVQPPVPPPRFDRSGMGVGPTRQFSGTPQSLSLRQPVYSDEDSDQWDDGDNYDQGASYA